MAFVSKSYTKRVKLYPHAYTPLLTVLQTSIQKLLNERTQRTVLYLRLSYIRFVLRKKLISIVRREVNVFYS